MLGKEGLQGMHRIAFLVAGRPSPAPQEKDMHIAVLGMAMERYVAAAPVVGQRTPVGTVRHPLI